MDQVAERLAELRERRALTLRELSEMSGVAADTINQIELGHRRARPSTLRKLARALEIDVQEFYAEPVLGKAKAPREAGRTETEVAQVLEMPQDAFQRRIKNISAERLSSLARDLVSGYQNQNLEEFRSMPREEKVRRVIAFSRANDINKELLDRPGEELPERSILALWRFGKAMNSPADASEAKRRDEVDEAG